MNSKKTFLAYLVMLIISIHSINSFIIADAVQPIKVIPPNIKALEASGTTIIFKFSTDATDFQGIRDNQAISIKFDPTSAVSIDAEYSCTVEIKNGGDVVGTTVKTIFPNIDDQRSALCIITNEPYLAPLAYTFVVTLNIKQTLPVHKIRSAWIAFTNSSNANRMLISPTELVAATPKYDIGVVENSVMTINEVSRLNLTPPSGCTAPCTTLYPYSTFEITVTLTMNNYFNTKLEQGAILALAWANSDFDFSGATITSFKGVSTSTSLLHAALIPTSGNAIALQDYLNIPNTKKIANLDEDMFNGRKFQLKISGIVCPDYVTTDAQNLVAHLNFLIYYKNDYARYGVVSTKNSTTVPLFQVNKAPIIMGNNDPSFKGIFQANYSELFENTTTPIVFVFNLPPMPSGGFIRIEHEYSQYKLFHFVASTCDFSDGILSGATVNSIFTGNLGERPICYPTNNSLTSRDQSNNVTAASGIYFKVPQTFTSNKVSVNVWGLVAKCSENDYLNETSPFNLNIYDSTERAKNSKVLSFNIKAYKKINLESDNIFSTENLVADSGSVNMDKECHGTLISHRTSHNNFNLEPFYSDTSVISATSDAILLKEFNDFDVTDTSVADGDMFFLDSTKKKYFLSSDNAKNLNSITGIEFGLTLSKTIQAPVPIYLVGSTVTTYSNTSLKMYFSRGFITVTANALPNCKLRWFNSVLTGASTDTSLNFIGSSATITNKAFLATDGSSGWTNQDEDSELDFVPNPDIVRKPIYLENAFVDADTKFVTDINSMHLGFNTNCFKFRTNTTAKMKSLYSHIDFTYIFSRSGYINRVGRFVKLVSAMGVFNQPTTSTTITGSTSFFFAFSSGSDSVCLLKLSSSIFYSELDRLAVVITLINVKLLNVDANDLASTYPVAPLYSNAVVYAQNTIYPFDFIDAKTHSSLLNRQYNGLHSAMALPYSYSDYVKNPSNYSYYNYLGSTLTFYTQSEGKFTTTNNTQIDTFLPIYCPKGGETIDNKDQLSLIIPSVSIFSFKFNNVANKNTWNLKNEEMSNIYFDLNNGSSDGQGTTSLLFKRNILEPATSNINNKVNIYFSEYTTDTILGRQRLYVKESVPVNGIPPETKCNSIILFMTNLINHEAVVQFETETITSTYVGNYGFYYNNKRFTKAFMYSIPQNAERIYIPGIVGGTDEYKSFVGINRPSIDQYTTANPSNANDIAFQCIRMSTSGDGSGRFYNNWETTSLYFQTEFRKLNADNNFWTIQAETEQSNGGTVYKGDLALKLNFEISVPSKLPKIGSIFFKSSQLTAPSVCAINHLNINYPALPCSDVVNNSITCNLSSAASQSLDVETLNICCYNVKINPDVEVFVDNETEVRLDSNTYSISFLYKDPISGEADTSIDYSTSYIPSTSSSLDYPASIPTILGIYSDQVYQPNGLGSVIFHVNLQRPAVANQRIRIKGAFSLFFIPNYKPRCQFIYTSYNTAIATVGATEYTAIRALTLENSSNYENGNYFVDKCILTTTDANKSQHTIELYNKNYIYKCNLLPAPYQSLVIRLTPVKLLNLSSNSTVEAVSGKNYALNRYFISSGITNFELENKIANVSSTTNPQADFQPFPATVFGAYSTNPLTQSHLCDVFNLLPPTIGSAAEYIFKIDLTPFSSFTHQPNEVTLYFDPEIFPYPDDNKRALINCYLGTTKITNSNYCNWSKNGFFNIYLPSTLSPGLIYYIKIENIINSSLDSTYVFQCSLNKIYDVTGYPNPAVRVNEIVGNGFNSYVNYYTYAEPDSSIFDSNRSYPTPKYSPYLKVIGPNDAGKFIVGQSTTGIADFPERENIGVYLMYKSTDDVPTVDSMRVNFLSVKEKYMNNITNNQRIVFYEINITTDTTDGGLTLQDSFTTPSFRILTPSWKQYSLSSTGFELESFVSESISNYHISRPWPYLDTYPENGITLIINKYAPTQSLEGVTKIYLFHVTGDTTDPYNHLLSEYNAVTAIAPFIDERTIEKAKITIASADSYRLINIHAFTLPSIRIVLPNGVIKTFTSNTASLATYLTEVFDNYYSYSDGVPDVAVPIVGPKLILFTNSNATKLSGDSDALHKCKFKTASNLLASFYQFKDYYSSLLGIIDSYEITYVDIDMNNSLCDGKIDFDGNVWPSVVYYLPDGTKYKYVPELPEEVIDEDEDCPHTNHFWNIYNLVTEYQKYFISKADLNIKLQSSDASIVLVGNSFKDEEVFQEVVTERSNYLPFYMCRLEECLTTFKVSNGDVLFFNSKFQPYNDQTDVRVLSNAFTSVQLSEFIKSSYVPTFSTLNNEILYQIFYKRTPAIIIMLYNDSSTSNINNYINIANNASVDLRVSLN